MLRGADPFTLRDMVTCTIDRCRHLESRRARLSAGRPLDDAELGRRFRDGEAEAVREVHRRYSRPLMTVAMRHLFDAEQAKDAVQQTLLQAWRGAPRFDVDRPLGPWLFQICRRVCIDQLRAKRARTESVDDHDDDLRLSVDGTSMEQAWVAFEVRRAIDELPPETRDIVRLIHLDGWTVQQTAELLELPLGTVKSRSFRAHKRLSAALGHLRVLSDR